MAYWARPAGTGRYPAVMICHENRGTSPHFEDVARRYAKAGYVGIALDLLSRQGGTAAVPPNEIGGFISGPGAAEQQVSDFQAAMAFLRRQPFVIADRIGMTGFCFGGGVTWNVAVKEPTLRAAVPYYGPSTAFPNDVGNIRAAVMAECGALDTRVTENNVALTEQLAALGKTVKLNVYPDANHAFFNDTGERYNEAAALAAWRDTLAWFATYLRGAGLPGTGDGSTAEEGDGEGVPEEAAAGGDVSGVE
jgi:carboxymethylenebutenolidase